MIVAHISKRLPWGLGAVVYNLCKYSRCFQPMVITMSEDVMDASIKKLAVPFFLTKNPNAFLKQLKHVDVINLHCFDADLRLYKVLKPFKIPIVLTLHFSVVFPRVDSTIICVTDWLKSTQNRLNKCIVIENAIDLERFFPVKNRCSNDKIIIARICRESKCEEFFWPAVVEVLNERDNVKFWIIGESGGSTQKIKRFGFHSDISKILSKVDIVIHTPPLKSAAKDMVVMEVMAMGIPAIFSDVECVRASTSGKIGSILVNPNDSKALKRKLLSLIDNPGKRLEIGKAAAEIAIKKFDAKYQVKQYEDTYRKAIQKKVGQRNP